MAARIQRAGIVAGVLGYLLAVLVLVNFYWRGRHDPELFVPAITGFALAGAFTAWAARFAGPVVARQGFKGALWVGPVSAVAALAAGCLGVVVGNLPVIQRELSKDGVALEVAEAWLARPIVIGMVWGWLPAALVGLLCGVGLWTYLQCIAED